MASFETTEEDATWADWLTSTGTEDVYYAARYGRIWAAEESGRFIGIRYSGPAGVVLYPLILVPLDSLPGGAGLLEARTPYDFGGPRGFGEDLDALQKTFRAALLQWLASQGVVSEFARLHPLCGGGRPADAKLHAENFVVDLAIPHDDLFAAQHRRHRRAVRAFTKRHGDPSVTSDIHTGDAAMFIDLYRDTMERVGASTDYYFGSETLRALSELDEMSLIRAGSVDDPSGAALFLRSGADLFYFLGASSGERPAGTNNAIFDAAIRYGQSLGLRMLHLGGGSESLRSFKSQIASGSVPYYVLLRVVDRERYSALCEACGATGATQFPAFRPLLVANRRDRAHSRVGGGKKLS